MVAKAKACLKIAERKLQASNTFTTDYEVEPDVAFFIKKMDDPIHIFKKCFKYENMIKKMIMVYR